jgi:hypothetical protein
MSLSTTYITQSPIRQRGNRTGITEPKKKATKIRFKIVEYL